MSNKYFVQMLFNLVRLAQKGNIVRVRHNENWGRGATDWFKRIQIKNLPEQFSKKRQSSTHRNSKLGSFILKMNGFKDVKLD